MKIKTFYGSNGPYLTVYVLLDGIVRGRRYSLCVHQFHRGDEDPDCHDHPFDFWSMILWGGYREYLENGTHLGRRLLSFGYRPATFRHRVQLTQPSCWTLILKRDAHREWGFWKNGTFIPWRQYIEAKGLRPIGS